MGNRIVYGNSHSENGWPMVDSDSCEWVDVPGANVRLQIQQGWPLAILRAFAADFNAYVEPLRDADSACWTPTNSVATSNHLSGTAMDLNWESHPFRVRGTYGDKLPMLRELLDWYEKTVWFGGDWRDPIDEMHFQCGSNTYGNPHTADFINRKIRPDGFSLFRRGKLVDPPATDLAQVLARAMGGGVSPARYQQLLPAVQAALAECDCTTVDRIAMWCAQIGHESGGLKWMEEIASGADYEGRRDLGNTQPGDGVRFKGRGPIQVTGRNNYAALSRWANDRGLVPTPTYFVDNPAELSSDKYGFTGAIWYWTAARPMNSYADRGDIIGATKAVNGGTNGLDDRTTRWNRCRAMGDELLRLVTVPPTPVTDELEELLMLSVPSLSIYATPGEPDVPVTAMIQALDAHGSHEEYVERQARLGDPDALARVARTAAGKGKFGNAAAAVNQAKAVLADIEATTPELLQRFVNGAKS